MPPYTRQRLLFWPDSALAFPGLFRRANAPCIREAQRVQNDAFFLSVTINLSLRFRFFPMNAVQPGTGEKEADQQCGQAQHTHELIVENRENDT